jgi:hypothetical protein
MPGPDPRRLKTQVVAVNSKLEALLKLIGHQGTAEDKWEYLEILFGITSRAEYELAASHLDSMQAALTQVEVAAKALKATAKVVTKATATAKAKAAGA